MSCTDDRGGEASSSWAPSDHVASGDENVPLDIRDEVISPPTTFAEANAEGGIPSASRICTRPKSPFFSEA